MFHQILMCAPIVLLSLYGYKTKHTYRYTFTVTHLLLHTPP